MCRLLGFPPGKLAWDFAKLCEALSGIHGAFNVKLLSFSIAVGHGRDAHAGTDR